MRRLYVYYRVYLYKPVSAIAHIVCDLLLVAGIVSHPYTRFQPQWRSSTDRPSVRRSCGQQFCSWLSFLPWHHQPVLVGIITRRLRQATRQLDQRARAMGQQRAQHRTREKHGECDSSKTGVSCHQVLRKKRHTLSNDEKSSYLTAVKCLMESPAKTGIKGAVYRWDELQALHSEQSNFIHGVG